MRTLPLALSSIGLGSYAMACAKNAEKANTTEAIRVRYANHPPDLEQFCAQQAWTAQLSLARQDDDVLRSESRIEHWCRHCPAVAS